MEEYAECAATASPLNQRRCPSNPPKPSAFRFFLLELSKHFGEKDVENFKNLLVNYGHKDDKGALTVEQLQTVPTTFRLLMLSAKAGVIQPDDLSSLMDFFHRSGRDDLVQRIEDFRKRKQSESICSGENQ